MYLSRVEIDTMDRQKISDLNHLGAYHNWVERSFPSELEQGIRTRKLWRIDQLGNHDYLLLVSQTKPDLQLLEKYGVANSAQTKDYDTFLQKISKGTTARFRAILNPTFSKSTGKKSGQRGKVMECLSVEDQLNYLEKRASKNGFKLMPNEYTITENQSKLLKKSGNRDGSIKQVAYEGRLMVEDEKLFKQLLCMGLGHKKAYGCGLVTIIPEER